jgi:hypothetical protein
MADVRVLFDTGDQIAARRLLDALLDRDFTADAATDQAGIRKAKAVIVLWSPAAINNPGLVRAARKARREGRLLQVKTKPCDVPQMFGERDGVILTDWTGDAADLRFQKIAAGARSLIDGVGPGGARPPEGLGWAGRRWRTGLVLLFGAVTALAGGIGVLQNLKTGKDWVCGIEPLKGACRQAGLSAPSPADVLTRLEGRWGASDCQGEIGRLTLAADRKSFALAFPSLSSRASIDATSENRVMVTRLAPPVRPGEDREARILVEEGRLVFTTANRNDSTELYRCGD